MLLPNELKKSEFSKSFKGYAVSEVEEYIAYLLKVYAEACNEYAELERKYSAVVKELENAKSEENTISTTIVNAQKMADAIVSDAKEKAVGIRNAVSDSCDKILDVYMTKVTAERDKLAECEAAVEKFKASLLHAYEKHLDLIHDIMPDEEATPYLSDEELEDRAVEIANEKIDEIVGAPSFDGSSETAHADEYPDDANVGENDVDNDIKD